MMISQTMNAALNRQAGSELAASNEYLAAAARFASDGLPELAARFFRQADEEREHALKFLKYIVETGGSVEIPAIPAPPGAPTGVEAAVRAALDWELAVTDQINKLVKLAVEEGDYLSQNFLGWFVTEQLEEVSSMDNLLRVVQRASGNLLYVESYVARLNAKP